MPHSNQFCVSGFFIRTTDNPVLKVRVFTGVLNKSLSGQVLKAPP